MPILDVIRDALNQLLELGGPVVLILAVMSIIALTLVFYKLWQFAAAGVGRHRDLIAAIDLWDSGAQSAAQARIGRSPSYLAPVLKAGLARAGAGEVSRARIEAEAAARIAKLEGGFRLLDTIAQLAPLLGLFGTVLGMIDAFRALQQAGSAVDPTILAGGIWVALLTTAAGLAVAMPTAAFLSWFEARMARERMLADVLLHRITTPGLWEGGRMDPVAAMRTAHAT